MLTALERDLLMIWIKGDQRRIRRNWSAASTARRSRCITSPSFWKQAWIAYRVEKGCRGSGKSRRLHPLDLCPRAGPSSARAIQAMARRGVTVTAEEVSQINTVTDFNTLIARAIDRKDS